MSVGTLRAYFEKAMIGRHWCKCGGRRRVTVKICSACKDCRTCEDGLDALRKADLCDEDPAVELEARSGHDRKKAGRRGIEKRGPSGHAGPWPGVSTVARKQKAIVWMATQAAGDDRSLRVDVRSQR